MEPLKERLDTAFFRKLAGDLRDVWPAFDRRAFLRTTTKGLDELELKQRISRTAEACREHLPPDYRDAVEILCEVASRYGGDLGCLFVPEYVGLYGLEDFDYSLDALRRVTRYASGEFAIREFLERDFERAMDAMHGWSRDADPHVRRLASEGSRPRLPWGRRIRRLIDDPTPTVPILARLRTDPEEFVRRSVANHLNDIAKDHPETMLDLVKSWERSDPGEAWVVKHAARGLLKAGHPRSFALFGFEARPKMDVSALKLSAKRIRLGEEIEFSVRLKSRKKKPQKLAIDYAVHYVKKSGKRSPKVFKLKEAELAPGGELAIRKRQRFQDFSIRTHHAGRHRIEIVVNGKVVAAREFELVRKG